MHADLSCSRDARALALGALLPVTVRPAGCHACMQIQAALGTCAPLSSVLLMPVTGQLSQAAKHACGAVESLAGNGTALTGTE
jgi:hypothetical protein